METQNPASQEHDQPPEFRGRFFFMLIAQNTCRDGDLSRLENPSVLADSQEKYFDLRLYFYGDKSEKILSVFLFIKTEYMCQSPEWAKRPATANSNVF
jgi:hypothetical protein